MSVPVNGKRYFCGVFASESQEEIINGVYDWSETSVVEEETRVVYPLKSNFCFCTTWADMSHRSQEEFLAQTDLR